MKAAGSIARAGLEAMGRVAPVTGARGTRGRSAKGVWNQGSAGGVVTAGGSPIRGGAPVLGRGAGPVVGAGSPDPFVGAGSPAPAPALTAGLQNSMETCGRHKWHGR